MQATTPPATAPSPADPGFRLPEQSATPQDASPQTLPDTAARPVEVMPVDPAALPVADTSDRDLAVGGIVFLILLTVYFFVRGAWTHHLVRKRVAPSSAGNAGWLMFVGLGFLSAAAVLAIINSSRFLNVAVTGPLVAVGLVALAASLFIGRR